jgi:hypothetical protein
MPTTVSGSYPAVNSDSDATVNGLTVGKGGSATFYATAVGSGALAANTSGSGNSAFGYNALTLMTTGSQSTALGNYALSANTTGTENTGVGSAALYLNTTGNYNTSVGRGSLQNNTTASQNTAVGYQAAYSNTTGLYNTALGYGALFTNSTGQYNTAVGRTALNLATGSLNTAVGYGSGEAITTGAKNTIIGGYTGNQGGLDIRTASNYIVLSDGDGNPRAYWNGSGTSTFTANVNGDTAMYMINNGNSSPFGLQMTFLSATPNNTSQFFFLGNDSTNNKVVLYSNGTVTNRTGTYNAFSDINLKQDIVDAGSQWDDIKAVRVRKFRLKDDVAANPEAKPMIGVIAQELEQTSAGLIDDCEDRDGTVTKAVKYSILYMKSIKALQEAMERIETLEAKVTALENK